MASPEAFVQWISALPSSHLDLDGYLAHLEDLLVSWDGHGEKLLLPMDVLLGPALPRVVHVT